MECAEGGIGRGRTLDLERKMRVQHEALQAVQYLHGDGHQAARPPVRDKKVSVGAPRDERGTFGRLRTTIASPSMIGVKRPDRKEPR